MGHFISIRGWLECPESQIPEVKEIISSFVEKAKSYGLTTLVTTLLRANLRLAPNSAWLWHGVPPRRQSQQLASRRHMEEKVT